MDKINQYVLYDISENMSDLVQTGKYGIINIRDTIKMGYYVNKLVPEPYTLQEKTTCNGKISIAGELAVKVQYVNCMQ